MKTALPRGVWVLGFASLFMDMSSELVHSLLPVFMVTVLGTSMLTVGLIEGIAEATAAVTKVFSGALSDYFGKRKGLLVAGYALAALSKPMFPLATSAGWVFAARFIDRIGKGIRGAPRDALVADITPPGLRGAAYGLRQSLDSVGAFLGPLLAVLFMLLLNGDIQAVMWFAVIPAVVTVLLLVVFIREPAHVPVAAPARTMPLSRQTLAALPLRYWLVVSLGALFTLARFSEAFLVLRAQDLGMTLAFVPVIMIVMNICYALGAYPAGMAADRLSTGSLLQLGLVLLIAADLVLATAGSVTTALLGAALWGGHMAFTQGLLAKLVADTAPVPLRGTAFGFFNLVSGVALLLASLIAGLLWDAYGPAACFIAGAVIAAFTAALLFGYGLYQRRQAATGSLW